MKKIADYIKPIKIGDFISKGNLIMAPMAGYTDLPYRLVLENFGADITYTEMVNVKGICRNDPKTLKLLDTRGQKKPVAAQIFGKEPEYISEAAKIIEAEGRFSFIDINMGCPVPKVVKNGEGSSLMLDETLAAKITQAAANAVKLPITVKIRKGWDKAHANAPEFAKTLENAGAKLITVHGRTRSEFFAGEADKAIIQKTAESVNIPVVANGGIKSVSDAYDMFDKTNCAGIMLARGAVGNPVLFTELKTGDVLDKYQKDMLKIDTLIKHYELSLDIIGEKLTVLNMRKHMSAYLKSMPNSSRIKQYINLQFDIKAIINTLEEYKKELETYKEFGGIYE